VARQAVNRVARSIVIASAAAVGACSRGGSATSEDTNTVLKPMLPKLFAHLGAPAALPALLHCGTGRGRACAAMAIVFLALGVPPPEIANDFAHNQEIGADPKWLGGVFAKIQSTGGIAAYLDFHRVAGADVASLRAQALK
jgi:hypothetical protein